MTNVFPESGSVPQILAEIVPRISPSDGYRPSRAPRLCPLDFWREGAPGAPSTGLRICANVCTKATPAGHHRYRLACCAPPSRDRAASRLCAFAGRRPASADFRPGHPGVSCPLPAPSATDRRRPRSPSLRFALVEVGDTPGADRTTAAPARSPPGARSADRARAVMAETGPLAIGDRPAPASIAVAALRPGGSRGHAWRRPHPLACPLSHGACRQTRKPRAIATASPAAPRRHAIRPRHGFVPSPAAVPPAPTFARGLPGCLLPAVCAVGGEAAHGFGGYAGAALAVLHFVARRRLPAVKRPAAMP